MKKNTAHPLLITLAILLIPVCLIWSSYVTTILWRWFAVPQFGLPEMSVPMAFGLSILLSHLRPLKVSSNKDDEDPDQKIMKAMLIAVFSPAFALGLGRIALCFF